MDCRPADRHSTETEVWSRITATDPVDLAVLTSYFRCIILIDMDMLQRVIVILASAEKALAEAANDAARGGQYDAASALIEFASALKALSGNARERLAPRAIEAVVGTKATTDIPISEHGRAVRSGNKSKKASYPQFLREGANLVKLGWSRSKKSEYEHKCHKKVLPILADAIAKAGVKGRRFQMDRVLPLADPADGTRIPDYQVYLCLAWFRTLGFLVQHGRQGYSLASKAPFEPFLESHWASLPSR